MSQDESKMLCENNKGYAIDENEITSVVPCPSTYWQNLSLYYVYAEML